MFKRNVILVALLGLSITSVAQATKQLATKSGGNGQTQPIAAGLSASGDTKRSNGDFTGAIVDYDKAITKIDADARRIAKLKADYEKMTEFEKMSSNQDEATGSYREWASLYYGRAMAKIGLGKKADARSDLDMTVALDKTFAD
ncbi:MAG TPA: hypothetical protein VI731_06165, partial [Bacteroidia bacterium]|nr:hypothetical protein [Bacteroidia bacterium]